MASAVEIPMSDCGLTINVGTDGVWLHFRSKSGLYVSINANNMAEGREGRIIDRALRQWCMDRGIQAAQLSEVE